jgi:hypothetical protein
MLQGDLSASALGAYPSVAAWLPQRDATRA